MNILILGLGGNVGDVKNTFSEAELMVKDEIGSVVKKSSCYQTKAWGNTNQPDFLNKVIIVETNHEVDVCLKKILFIEQNLGRVRNQQKWAERTIDIDILFYNQIVINSTKLTIPHPHLHKRLFVLIPLVEIIPDFYHPILMKNVAEILSICTDNLEVQKV